MDYRVGAVGWAQPLELGVEEGEVLRSAEEVGMGVGAKDCSIIVRRHHSLEDTDSQANRFEAQQQRDETKRNNVVVVRRNRRM